MVDFSRLTRVWTELAPRFSSRGVSVSTECADCLISFCSSDYTVHLRNEGTWWFVDKVDDRGQRIKGDARLSTFPLAEKYLLWRWATLARSSLASGRLGGDLYKQGYATGVDVFDLGNGRIEVCFQGECANLVTGTSTIFSHIMKMSADSLESLGRF